MQAARGSIDIVLRRLLMSLPVNLHRKELYMTHPSHFHIYMSTTVHVII